MTHTQLQFNGAKSNSISITAGVPQGSPLSPLLYMYYNADLLEVPQDPNKDLAMGLRKDCAGLSKTPLTTSRCR